jgi:hypothetical protein
VTIPPTQPPSPPPTGRAPFGKPAYINPAGDPRLSALAIAPPFMFRNVTARVFPIKANMAVLSAFCDAYLNMDISPSIVHFAPALPYVYLQVLNYGSMAPSSVQAQNVGWVAQHEVTFTVVLQKWQEVDNELVFRDWAITSPFIYVDDQLSLNTGREVYGWNKVTGEIESDIPLWVDDPAAKVRQFQLGLVDFAAAYAGANQTRQTLLQIDLDPPTTFTTFPPDPRNPWSPLWAVPNAVANSASLIGGVLDTALSLRIRGYETHRSIDGLRAMAAKAGEKLKSVFPDMLPSKGQAPNPAAVETAEKNLPTLFLENVTLKQFRNPENPDLACYQAIVKSKMGVERLNRAGLLGDVNLLRGDSSGGYRLHVHQYDAQPIIQTLGLEVDSWDRTGKDGGVATFKPILPYWLDVDLYYGSGQLICSRAHGSATEEAGYWRDEQEGAAPTARSPAADSRPLYNTTLGAATQPIAGPFHFPDVTLQVYPLLADRRKLDAVLKAFLNDPLASVGMVGFDGVPRKGWRFETFGSYVYMMVTIYGDQLGQMWSGTNNIGGLFDREVTFTVPVKWYDENDRLITVALIEPFTYSNNGRAVATDREVNGYNSIYATIESPADAWMTPDGPIAQRRFLHLATEVIPALNVGQKATQRTLIEIDERDALPLEDAVGWGVVADDWGRVVTDELKRKTHLATADVASFDAAKALALEILTQGAPVNRLIVKQYRDGEELDKACYQALVQATSTITSVYDLREMTSTVHVRVHQQPGHNIVEALGLKVKFQASDSGDVVDVLQPMRPFWMRVAMREDLATVACYRSEQGAWQIVHPWFEGPVKVQGSHGGDAAGKVERESPGPAGPTPGPAPTAAPARTSAFQQPFFERNNETRVGGWLARVPTETIPPRPTGNTLALFADAEAVRTWLEHRSDGVIFGADLHLDLKNASNEWLRRALINELAWFRVCLDPHRKGLRERLAGRPETAGFIACQIVPNAITDMADLYSIRQLVRLVNLIYETIPDDILRFRRELFDDPEEPLAADAPASTNEYIRKFETNLGIITNAYEAFFAASTDGIRKTGLAWSWDQFLDGAITSQILTQSAERFARVPEKRKQAFLMTLPKGAYPLLEDAITYINGEQYKLDTTFQDYEEVSLTKIQDVVNSISRLRILADTVDNCLLDWNHPDRWRRLSFKEAVVAIRKLDDAQVVVDDILSCEWENHSLNARFRNMKGGHKPTECIRLEPALEAMARNQGLERWIDPVTQQASEFWVVPMPGQSDPIKPNPLPLTSLQPAQQAVVPGAAQSGPAPPSTTVQASKEADEIESA